MLLKTVLVLSLILGALSLGLSVAHLLEMPQRVKFSRELWVEVTVTECVYCYFGPVGAVFEIGSIAAAFTSVFLLWRIGASYYWFAGGAVLLTVALISWIAFVSPMNSEFAKWTGGSVPANWTRYRDQWEYAHSINAAIKLLGFSALVIAAIKQPQ